MEAGKLDKDKTALFSGRFDPVHPGHLRTIKDLALRFSKVIVTVLEYEGRVMAPNMAAHILWDLSPGNVKVVTNVTHFGRADKGDLRHYGPFDIFVSGNEEVLDNMISLECEVLFWPRSYGYAASTYRE